MYLVSNNNVNLDANGLRLRPCYCYICAPTQSLKRFKFLAAKIESTTAGPQANCETPQTQLNKCSLLRFMNQDSIQMHFITGMNTVPHMTVSLTLPYTMDL